MRPKVHSKPTNEIKKEKTDAYQILLLSRSHRHSPLGAIFLLNSVKVFLLASQIVGVDLNLKANMVVNLAN